MNTIDRAAKSEATFNEARALAEANGFQLTQPSDGCYQLRRLKPLWIYNLYPRRSGLSPRIYSDPHHRGPFLRGMPEPWTLLDVVRAAIALVELERSKNSHPVSAALEHCRCGKPASHKIGEEIPRDNPAAKLRHNFTAHVCCDCFAQIMGPAAKDRCESLSSSLRVETEVAANEDGKAKANRRAIAAYPMLIEVLQEVALAPWPDSDLASLMETLRARAQSVLDQIKVK